jgi:hypothetical protein
MEIGMRGAGDDAVSLLPVATAKITAAKIAAAETAAAPVSSASAPVSATLQGSNT